MKNMILIMLIVFAGKLNGQNTPAGQQLIACEQVKQQIIVSKRKVTDSFSVQHLLIGNETPGAFSMQIFNRWGDRLFNSERWQACWYGYRDQKRLAEPGLYSYIISITDKSGYTETCKGVFTLVHK